MPYKQQAMVALTTEHRTVLKKLQATLTGHVGCVLTYGETIILAERIVCEALARAASELEAEAVPPATHILAERIIREAREREARRHDTNPVLPVAVIDADELVSP